LLVGGFGDGVKSFHFDLETGDTVPSEGCGRYMGDLPRFLLFLLAPCIELSFFDFFLFTLVFEFFVGTGEGLREIELYL